MDKKKQKSPLFEAFGHPKKAVLIQTSSYVREALTEDHSSMQLPLSVGSDCPCADGLFRRFFIRFWQTHWSNITVDASPLFID